MALRAKPRTYLSESIHRVPASKQWDTYRLTVTTITIHSTPKNSCMGDRGYDQSAHRSDERHQQQYGCYSISCTLVSKSPQKQVVLGSRFPTPHSYGLLIGDSLDMLRGWWMGWFPPFSRSKQPLIQINQVSVFLSGITEEQSDRQFGACITNHQPGRHTAWLIASVCTRPEPAYHSRP